MLTRKLSTTSDCHRSSLLPEYIATLKGISAEEMAQITTQNFERLFKIQVQ